MKRVHLHKIGSVTSRLQLRSQAVLGAEIPACAGTVVAGRILNSRRTYHTLENPQGRLVPLRKGDVIAGALGFRHALHGFAGEIPNSVAVGDTLQLLNLGGVIGKSSSASPILGRPFDVEILGAVLDFGDGSRSRMSGKPACISAHALPPMPLPEDLPPIFALVGTSMDSGKTTAASALVSSLSDQGKRVACGKLTGVSLRRDMLMQEDNGAIASASFTDFGIVTTNEKNAVTAAHSLIAYLNDHAPDVIVLELGDGLFGPYGVKALLNNDAFRNAISAYLLCAHDPVGAWGAVNYLQSNFSIHPTLVTGPVTDTQVGVGYCNEELKLPAANAMLDPHALASLLSLPLQPVTL
jgi:hypothetical protein